MKQEGKSQSYHLTIKENMVTDENDVDLGRMRNTELTRGLAEEELHNRYDKRFVKQEGTLHTSVEAPPMTGEEASKATDATAKSAMSYDEAEFIPDDNPDPERRGLDHKGNVHRGRDSDIVRTTLRVANEYDELQRKAAEIAQQQLTPPTGPSTPADQ